MLPKSVYKYTHSVSVLQSRLINYCSGINLICRKRLNLDRILVFHFFWHTSTTTSVVCASLCVQVCAYVHVSKNLEGSKGSEAPAGLFSTELSPQRQQSHYTQQPSTDWLHSAAVLEIEFFLSPTGTNHIAFTLFILLFCHTHSPAC